ncbi:MAG: NADH-quinone oxidoreductase subunit C [Desulfobulbaceae bacterium]
MAEFTQIHNGKALSLAELPPSPFDSFRRRLLELTRTGFVVHFFGFPDEDDLQVMAVIRQDGRLLAGRARLPSSYPSLTPERAKFHLFERELAEQYGVVPEGHPWLKMVRYHPNYSGRRDAFGNEYDEDIPGRTSCFQVEGEEIHEVAVGPVHAGIIEPGHFRFQCIGERVLHLEIFHGYQHRGVEPLLCSAGPERLPLIAESVAGDTSIANALCCCQAIEALAGMEISREARTARTIALELERLANHVGDLGALSGDVAFTPPAAFFGRMRGEFLNLLLLLSGNRFGRGFVRPGGVTLAADRAALDVVRAKTAELRPQLLHVADLLLSAHTVLARFEHCGIVSREAAECLGMVGPAGRASWLPYDVRSSFPTERYEDLPPFSLEKPTGDVLARARVRAAEIAHSLDCIEALLPDTNGWEYKERVSYRLAPSTMVVTMNEAWRGELSHCLLTDADGSLVRYKVKDPSFHNWSGLAMALRGEEISDFPLNNKSFNLSYCGMDL